MTQANGASRRPLTEAYQHKLTSGWQEDEAQAGAIEQLDLVLRSLGGKFGRPPKGVYLYGPVGRGKSQLLNLFMEQLTGVAARRVHMHEFIPQLHRRLNEIKVGDPVEIMAKELAEDFDVLGFDEFYVTDLGDGILLGRLMELLFKRGVVVVATSNWPLDELFRGGRNRQRLLPYIRTLKANLKSVDLGDGLDYRRSHDSDWPLYLPSKESRDELQRLFNRYAGDGEGRTTGRIKSKLFRGRAGWFQFQNICGVNVGRIEYLDLVRDLDTILIEGIPRFSATDTDIVLRLVALIDICYEHHRRVIISADGYPEDLYAEGPLAMAFARVSSRLAEMQSWT